MPRISLDDAIDGLEANIAIDDQITAIRCFGSLDRLGQTHFHDRSEQTVLKLAGLSRAHHLGTHGELPAPQLNTLHRADSPSPCAPARW